MIQNTLTPEELAQMAEIISIQRALSKETGSEQTLTLVFRNGHIVFYNASNNRKAVRPNVIMDDQYQWKET